MTSKPDHELMVCRQCGGGFLRVLGRRGRPRAFCSNACTSAWHREHTRRQRRKASA